MYVIDTPELNCQVPFSNLEVHFEDLEGAYYYDSADYFSIHLQIKQMISEKRCNINKNYRRSFSINNSLKSIDEAFSFLKHIRLCWGQSNKAY